MRLVIKEYLSQLKETKELDKLLPDLLLAMGFIPTSTPQVGVRQYGVDIASEYFDKKNNKILYLFVVKQGDIGRSDWDSGPQSVRQSLEEIKDVYLEKMINVDQKELTKKIVLCTNGILKHVAEIDWNGYKDKNTIKNKIEYELWDGFKLAQMIEDHMLNEYILLGNFKSMLRKTLALLGDSDYDISDYYALLKENLSVTEGDKKASTRLLYSIRLILNIIYNWSKENNNLKPALYAAERTLLNVWHFFKKNQYLDDSGLNKIFNLIFQDVLIIYTDYLMKIRQFCLLRNGLNGYSRYYFLENINLYEQLGIIAIAGLNHFYFGAICDSKENIDISENVKNILKAFINNHKSISSPVYDDHTIEILLALILLKNFNEIEFIGKWIEEIINRIEFAYIALGKYFPVDSDSLEDAVLLSSTDKGMKEKMILASTLLLTLLQFSAVLRLGSLYGKIYDIIHHVFKQTTLQIWFPDNTTDEYLYIENAGHSSGVTFVPMSLPNNVEDMNKLIQDSNEKYMNKDTISAIKEGVMALPLIASRHFRTPILPLYWCMFADSANKI